MQTHEYIDLLNRLELEFFRDSNKRGYAKVPIGASKKVLPVESVAFSDFVSGATYKQIGEGISEKKLGEVLAQCRAAALYGDDVRQVHIRTAPLSYEDPYLGVEIDLGTDDGSCVRWPVPGFVDGRLS